MPRIFIKHDDFVFIYHNCGNTNPLIPSISRIDADVYHFGNAVDMEHVLKLMPKHKIIMGNIDPVGCLKNQTEQEIKHTTMRLLEKCSHYPNFVISSGCDIPPKTSWKNLDAYFSAINDFYQQTN
jgi:uroporphyrinogen decarboxylase